MNEIIDVARWSHLLDRLRGPVPAAGEELDASVSVPPRFATRQEKLDAALQTACERGGFSGAALADASGMLFSSISAPLDAGALSAMAAVLADALERVAKLGLPHAPETISLDVGFSEKLVMRTFVAGSTHLCLLVFCSSEVDAGSELELTVGAVSAILHEA